MSPIPDDVHIRRLSGEDSIDELTDLLHRAYAGLAERGLRYVATYQDAATTRKRVERGECFVGVRDGRLVATITYYDPARTGGCPWYDRPDVAVFKQLCVDPALRRRGIAAGLMDLVEGRAASDGAAEIACDTAIDATDLVEMYRRRGYRTVEQVDWRPATNYVSVVLSKPLPR